MSSAIKNLLEKTLDSLHSLDNVENNLDHNNVSDMNQLYDIQTARLGILNSSSSIFDTLRDIRIREAKMQDLLNVLPTKQTYLESFDDISSNIANNKRMIQINAYYSKKYTAYIKILNLIILVCMPIIIISFLKKIGIITSRISMFLIILSIIVGGVYIGLKYVDISNRNNMFFDKYNVKLPNK